MTTNETELLKLEIQLRTLELQNLEEKKRLESQRQKHPAPLSLRIMVWFTFVLSFVAVVLIIAKAIIEAN